MIFDATHSVQQPGGKGTSSGGERVRSRAGARRGRGRRRRVFIETIPIRSRAVKMVPHGALREFEALVRTLMAFDALAKNLNKNLARNGVNL